MRAMSTLQDIASYIGEATGEPFELHVRSSVAGGCINETQLLTDTKGRRFFVKLNDAARRDMFDAEADGLREILASASLLAPQPVCIGEAGGSAFLVLEYLNMSGGRVDDVRLGKELAALHRHEQPRFGWFRSNTIGSTPQHNDPTADWLEFWRNCRLGFQLHLAAKRGYGGTLQRHGERLMAELEHFFEGYQPRASLLHGDLWSGNFGGLSDGTPVVFDPAVYYGDRETDLAMTELFGGFSANFYASYQNNYPLDSGYKTRKTLYNLYHILNHLNLFGGGYLTQSERMLDALLSEIR